MSIKSKIYWSIGIGIILAIVYYYIYSYFQIWFDDLCKKNYCIEFFPIGDFIACYIAIVGLYFVVTSLDAWKKQDKYNNAKARVAELNSLQPEITLGFGFKICSFYDVKQKKTEKKILRFDHERDYVVACFEAYLDDTQILEKLRNLERENYNVKNCLYQDDFDKVIEQAYKYLSGCVSEIKKLSLTEDDSKKNYENILTQIYKKHRNYEYSFKTELAALNRKLNEFIE